MLRADAEEILASNQRNTSLAPPGNWAFRRIPGENAIRLGSNGGQPQTLQLHCWPFRFLKPEISGGHLLGWRKTDQTGRLKGPFRSLRFRQLNF